MSSNISLADSGNLSEIVAMAIPEGTRVGIGVGYVLPSLNETYCVALNLDHLRSGN